jgi:hypothetical protein
MGPNSPASEVAPAPAQDAAPAQSGAATPPTTSPSSTPSQSRAATSPTGLLTAHGGASQVDPSMAAGPSTHTEVVDHPAAAQERPRIHLQSGIHKQKVYTDGNVKYSCFTSSGEPRN